MQVPKGVRYAMLEKYYLHCRFLFSIAFFQWRILFSKNSDKHVLEELIKDRMTFLYNEKIIGKVIEEVPLVVHP